MICDMTQTEHQINEYNLPGANESNIEVHNQWLQLVVPLCDSFSSLDYLCQIPVKAHRLPKKNYIIIPKTTIICCILTLKNNRQKSFHQLMKKQHASVIKYVTGMNPE